MSSQKRLRIFAGPNGSGKSTIINIVRDHGIDMGVYVNADDIKEQFLKNQSLDFANYELTVQDEELKEKLSDSVQSLLLKPLCLILRNLISLRRQLNWGIRHICILCH